jgi:hypothetical protein
LCTDLPIGELKAPVTFRVASRPEFAFQYVSGLIAASLFRQLAVPQRPLFRGTNVRAHSVVNLDFHLLRFLDRLATWPLDDDGSWAFP